MNQIAIFAAGCFWGDRRLRLMRQTAFWRVERQAKNVIFAWATLFLVGGDL